MFFRWYARTERERKGLLTWADVERQLHEVPPPSVDAEHPQPH